MQIDNPDDSTTPPTPNSPLPDIHSPDGFTSFSSSGSSDTISGKKINNFNIDRIYRMDEKEGRYCLQ